MISNLTTLEELCMAEDKTASMKETALEVPGRRKWNYSSLHSQCMERTLGNDKKHQDSKNYLLKNGNNMAKGTASQQQLIVYK